MREPPGAIASAEDEKGEGQRGVRAGGLLAVTLLGCLVAAPLGAPALADWAATRDPVIIAASANAWSNLTGQIGLGRPYDTLRRLIRAAENAQF